MIIFIDDFSKCIWSAFMTEKLEALTKVEEFKEKIKQELGRKIWCLCIHNEMNSHQMSSLDSCKSAR